MTYVISVLLLRVIIADILSTAQISIENIENMAINELETNHFFFRRRVPFHKRWYFLKKRILRIMANFCQKFKFKFEMKKRLT